MTHIYLVGWHLKIEDRSRFKKNWFWSVEIKVREGVSGQDEGEGQRHAVRRRPSSRGRICMPACLSNPSQGTDAHISVHALFMCQL